MIYRNDDIPQEYNKLAEISDNYLIWVRESSLQSGTNYSAYVQFFNPSFSCLLIDNYRIKSGTNYRLNAHYTSNNMYSYLDYYDVDYSCSTYQVDSNFISSDDSTRSDYLSIFATQILCLVCFLWVFKQLSRLFFKGGLA